MTREPIRVLVVEDDEVDRRFVRKALDVWDDPVELDEAETAESGLEAALEGDHDLVLLDYRLPDADGLTLLRGLHDQVRAPIVFMTAYGDEELATQAIKDGAADYLTKDDMSGQRLRLTLRNVLRTHELAHQVHAIGEEIDYLQDSIARKERIALVGVLSDRALAGVRGGIDHVRAQLGHLQEDVQATADRHPEHREFLMDVAETLEQDLVSPLHQLDDLVQTLENLYGLLVADPSPEEVDVDEVVRQRVGQFQPFKSDDVRLETDLQVDRPVHVDPSTVGECLTRLLKNATDAVEEGAVQVTTRLENGQVEIVVEDEGDGVPDVVGDRAFDLFMTTKPGHEGVGLTLVKHLVRNHGGTVGYENRSEGARFTVRLPEIPTE